MDAMELIKVRCCWEMDEDMFLEPRRLVRAILGHSDRGTLDSPYDLLVDAFQHE